MGVSHIMLRGLCAELALRGIGPGVLLEPLGLREEQLRASGSISADDFGTAIRAAVQLTGDEALGLSMGTQAPENMLQLVGHLVLSSGTMRDAIGLFCRYSALLASDVTFALEEREEQAQFRVSFEPQLMGKQGTRFTCEFVLAMAVRMGRHFAPHSQPTQVSFTYPAPSYQHRYHQAFGCPVVFERAQCMVQFPRALLDVQHLHGDETMRSFLRDAAEQLLSEAQRGLSTADRLRTFLRSRHDAWQMDADVLAKRLGLTRRSLGRRLRNEGITLSAIMEEERCRAACRQLSREGVCIKQTSERLGYSEPSAFHRAFKRWTGKTPAQFMRSPKGTQYKLAVGRARTVKEGGELLRELRIEKLRTVG